MGDELLESAFELEEELEEEDDGWWDWGLRGF